MVKSSRSTGRRWLVAAVAATLALSACASSGGDGSRGGGTATDVEIGYLVEPGGGDPVSGGTVTFGTYSFPDSLDPTKTQAAGSTGGTEMATVYDTLMRVEDGEFVPQLAESLKVEDDATRFVLGLRDGVTFSDGTALDADAVKWSIDRFVAAGADVSQAWADVVDQIVVTDPHTVEFRLKRSWDDFPVLLSMGPGMIVGQGSEAGSEFTPIGAGPFTVERFVRGDELVVTAREDYFGGRPYLDTITFVPTAGAQGQLESLRSGQLDMAYILRNEEVIRDLLDGDHAGYLDVVGLATIGLINNRPGRPGADVRVRQAINYGIDPEAINERATDGLGMVSSEILPETSQWYAGAEGVAYDPERARELLEQAKADGYDGRLTYLTTTDPEAEAAALTAQASLNTLGFDVTIDYAASVTDLVRKLYVEHDFDLTRAAYQFMDEAPYLRLYGGLGSDSRNNASGYENPQMDELLTRLQTSTDHDAKTETIVEIQELVNETVPYTLWGPVRILLAWDPDIHGVTRSADNMVLFDQAWVQ